MKAMFVHSTKFKKYKNNFYSNQVSYEIWKERYLRYINKMYIVSRVEEVSSPEGYNISNGENVQHITMPNFRSNVKFIKDRKSIYKMLEKFIQKNDIDIVIARVPSVYSFLAIKAAKNVGVKIVVEMVGDPFTALWTHGSIKGKIYAPISYFRYRKQLKYIDNIIFVTESYLQSKYKPKYKSINSTNISNVNLSEDKKFDIEEKKIKKPLINNTINISTIGSYASKYKGYDTAIKFIRELRILGYNVHLYILGSGDKSYLVKLMEKYNLEHYIHFIPQIQGGEEVLQWLDNYDLYIQPSLTEGLPRALIEAMSRGLPAIGTKVGGIPELLDESVLVNTKSSAEMVSVATQLLNDKDFYNEQVKSNFIKSKLYRKDKLSAKRDEFWNNIL